MLHFSLKLIYCFLYITEAMQEGAIVRLSDSSSYHCYYCFHFRYVYNSI